MCKSSLKQLTALVSVLLILLQPQFILAQEAASKPIKKESMFEVIQRNLLSTRELTQRVEQRGVDFRLTSQDEVQLRQAGARPELIHAVRANYRATAAPPAPVIAPKSTTTKPKPAAPKPLVSYEDLLDRSLAAINTSQWDMAGGMLNQALKLNPAHPMAYSLLGYTMLYGRGDLFTAEQAMRAAMERNGTVCFEV